MSRLTIDKTRKNQSSIPYQQPLPLTEFYQKGKYDVYKILDFFRSEGRLSKPTILEIIRRANKILSNCSETKRWSRTCSKLVELHG